MDPHTPAHKNPGHKPTHDEPQPNSSGVVENAQSLWHEVLKLGHDSFSLVALEIRRAGESLLDMMLAGVAIALLMTTAWLGLMAALVLGLVEQGFLASNAMLIAVACNCLLALGFYGVITRKRRYLQFPATLRIIKPKPTVHAEIKQP
jgi:hypothetical protein